MYVCLFVRSMSESDVHLIRDEDVLRRLVSALRSDGFISFDLIHA